MTIEKNRRHAVLQVAVRKTRRVASANGDVFSKIGLLIAEIGARRRALHRALSEAKAQRARFVTLASAIRKLADRGDLPAEVADAVSRIDTLTWRQRSVFERILEGQANKVIAFDLGVSAKTVETHRARIMRKLGAHSLAELVRISMRGHAVRDGRPRDLSIAASVLAATK